MKNCILLIIIAVTGIANVYAGIGDVFNDGKLVYQITSEKKSEVMVSGYVQSPLTGDLVIPSTVELDSRNYKVTKIDRFALEGTEITSVTLPETMTYIDYNAFYECSKLEDVKASDSLKYVGDYVFKYTPWLDNQPDGVVYVGRVAYLYKGTIPDNTDLTLKEGTVSVGGRAFQGQKGLKSISMPASLIYIGVCAFAECENLESVQYSENLEQIGLRAFRGTKWRISILNDVEVYLGKVYYNSGPYPCPNTVVKEGTLSIAPNAFSGSRQLLTISLPQSLRTIGDNAFENCTGLVSVQIPDSVERMDGWIFSGCTGLTSVVLPKSLESIEAYMFNDCTKLSSVTIPESVSYLSYCVFSNCGALKNLVIPKSVTRMDKTALDGSKWYENQPDGMVYAGSVAYKYKGSAPAQLKIKEGTVSLGSYSLDRQGEIVSVHLPITIEHIGNQPFYGCLKMTSMTVENPIPPRVLSDTFLKAGNDYFYPSCTVTIPKNFLDQYKADPIWGQFTNYREQEFAGIQGPVASDVEDLDAPMYNVMGQRIDKPYRGQLYIQNGRKKVYNGF